ncbi:c-type cytochrome [Deinococcus sp. HMF7604]|uniref:c-type cytochrome n=1 Tax=Deinococcus betulae TaxID=2873312 RepID=UPI001CCE8B1D|nr:c-type cytochrome [Deinococcus betulae]MBZ9750299.1 c-type cytochrome [Deinococcus betulae]
MKNTFAVTMTLLLALTLGGSIAGYRIATTPHHEEEAHKETPTPGSEEAPSPNSAATGAEGDASAQGDVRAENDGGTQAGENGAVIASSDLKTGDTPAASTEGTAENTPPSETVGQTGQEPADTAAAAEPEGDPSAGGKLFVGNCAGCHGPEGQGGVGPALGQVKEWNLAQFTAVLREGKTPERELSAVMPRFSEQQLTDSDIANIYTFVKTLN